VGILRCRGGEPLWGRRDSSEGSKTEQYRLSLVATFPGVAVDRAGESEASSLVQVGNREYRVPRGELPR